MRIIYGKTNWECQELSLEAFMARVLEHGFDAAELYIPNLKVPPSEIAALTSQYGLEFIADIATEGATPSEHQESLARYADYALETGAILINAHTGRDFFPFSDNVRLFELGLEIAEKNCIPFAHETHRSRALYSAIETRRYLEALPELAINADFSHWMNVHESDLRDQPENVSLAIERAIHIHARVGHEEGPQVNDPRAPEWAGHLANHIDLWQRIADTRQARQADMLTITPEFGPIPYVPTMPYTQEPLADIWEVNVFMKDILKEKLVLS
jgi:sugar phosphate isomerase/epimerase